MLSPEQQPRTAPHRRPARTDQAGSRSDDSDDARPDDVPRIDAPVTTPADDDYEPL